MTCCDCVFQSQTASLSLVSAADTAVKITHLSAAVCVCVEPRLRRVCSSWGESRPVLFFLTAFSSQEEGGQRARGWALIHLPAVLRQTPLLDWPAWLSVVWLVCDCRVSSSLLSPSDEFITNVSFLIGWVSCPCARLSPLIGRLSVFC